MAYVYRYVDLKKNEVCYIGKVTKDKDVGYNPLERRDNQHMREEWYKERGEDLNRDSQLLQKYVNVISAEMNAETDIPQETSEKIKDALISYRTEVCKKKRIKAYEVFRNISCERIAKFAPLDIDALKALRCLDEIQINTYGGEIINIVADILKPAVED